jgi:hypothetical protein
MAALMIFVHPPLLMEIMTSVEFRLQREPLLTVQQIFADLGMTAKSALQDHVVQVSRVVIMHYAILMHYTGQGDLDPRLCGSWRPE